MASGGTEAIASPSDTASVNFKPKIVYTIVADLMLPERIQRLDGAQRVEVRTALAWAALHEARRSEIPLHGVEMEVTQGGAVVVLDFQAPTLEEAEAAAELLVAAMLRSHERLSGWRIASCAARFDRLRLEESFYSLTEDDGPP
jgi:hypothetical protein